MGSESTQSEEPRPAPEPAGGEYPPVDTKPDPALTEYIERDRDQDEVRRF